MRGRNERADSGAVRIEGFGDVEVEGLSRGHPEVEAVAGNCLAELLRIFAQHRAGSGQRGIAGGGGRKRNFAKKTGACAHILKGGCRCRKESGGEHFRFSQVIGPYNRAADSRGAVGFAQRTSDAIKFTIQRHAFDHEFPGARVRGRTPDDYPSAVHGDPLACSIQGRTTVHLSSSRDDDLAVIKDIFGDESNHGCVDAAGLERDDGSARDHSPVRC